MSAAGQAAQPRRIAGMEPAQAQRHLAGLRLQIRKAGGCLARIEAADATRAERDAARVAFHRHAEAIAHTMILLERAPLFGQLAGETAFDVLVAAVDIAAEERVEDAVAAVRHG